MYVPPDRGSERKEQPVRETIAKLLASLQASIETHKMWWAGGGGAVLVVIVALVVAFGGFFGPDGKAICTVALNDARDYGVIPTTASLANNEAKSTDDENRKQCTAESGSDNYTMTVDLTCKDVKNKDCIALYSVQRADGLTTYQVRQVPDDDADAGVGQDGDQAAADSGQSPDGSAAEESDIQPATGTHSGDAGQAPADAGTQPQQ